MGWIECEFKKLNNCPFPLPSLSHLLCRCCVSLAAPNPLHIPALMYYCVYYQLTDILSLSSVRLHARTSAVDDNNILISFQHMSCSLRIFQYMWHSNTYHKASKFPKLILIFSASCRYSVDRGT